MSRRDQSSLRGRMTKRKVSTREDIVAAFSMPLSEALRHLDIHWRGKRQLIDSIMRGVKYGSNSVGYTPLATVAAKMARTPAAAALLGDKRQCDGVQVEHVCTMKTIVSLIVDRGDVQQALDRFQLAYVTREEHLRLDDAQRAGAQDEDRYKVAGITLLPAA